MFTDPEWKGIPVFDDPKRRSELLRRMQAAVAEKSLAEWQAIFEADPNVFAEVCRSGPAVLKHPQLLACGEVAEVVADESGPVRQPGALTHAHRRRGRRAPAAPAPAANGAAQAWQAPAAPAPGGSRPGCRRVRPAASGRHDRGDGGAVRGALRGDRAHRPRCPRDQGRAAGRRHHPHDDALPGVRAASKPCRARTASASTSQPGGVDIVRKCAGRADIVLDGFRPGAAERHGLGPESLRKVNPNLVYVSASGYGEGGPDSNRPAFAPSIGAAGGITRANLGDAVQETSGLSLAAGARGVDAAVRRLLHPPRPGRRVRRPGRRHVAPARPAGQGADGRGAAGVIVDARHSRACHGRACHRRRRLPSPAGPGEDLRGPPALYRIYDAADGWVFLAASPTPTGWRLEALRDEASTSRPTPALPAQHSARRMTGRWRRHWQRCLLGRGKDEWEQRLLAADVGCVAVAPSDRAGAAGRADRQGKRLRRRGEPPGVRRAPPAGSAGADSRGSATQAKPGVLAGQATDDVLTELGYDSDAIAELRARKIVG